MNKGKRGIRGRGLQRGLGGRPRAPRKVWSRVSADEINGDILANDRFTRAQGLLHAALRVWELKHGFRD